MKFGAPEFIKWLLLIIPLILLFAIMQRQRMARLERLVSSGVWRTVIPGYSKKRSRSRTVLRLIGLFCILLALTRPQWGSHWEEVKQRGLDIIVVLDTSKSMLAEDVKPNRLQQAQWAVRDFVKHLKGDRIGLVAFAGSSFLQCPLTVDYAAFTMMLDDLYVGIIPRGGTAIEQALKTADDSFDTKSDADRVIILITDGEDHEGDPMRMAEELHKQGIKLFSIGVGSADGDLIPTPEGYVKDSQGRIVKTSLNEPLLEKLASETGGFYVRSAPGDFGLDRIYKLGISGLRRGEQDTRLAKVYEERFDWFAAAALFFLLVEGLLRPSGKVLLLLLLSTAAPHADASEWAKAYRSGDYTNALRTLEKSAAKFPDIENYNRGNILFRMNDFQGAEKAYAKAAEQTENPKLKEKALYNRGTALLAEAVQQSAPVKADADVSAAMQAVELFERALLLNPDDIAAKENLERAVNLIVQNRIQTAAELVRDADGMMTAFKAKAARENYVQAKNLLKPVLNDFSPGSPAAQALSRKADEQLRRLDDAIKKTRSDLEQAKQAIDAYDYKTAADLMMEDKAARKLAFDLDQTLKEEFTKLIENNMNVINIVYPDNPFKL
ncbi:MAG: Ca-activated chloride channel [Verrucomicrobiota bacterium]|jgi:Ca-activated chloride channel family protein|nr:Ca-activated chloride channel [Verrucomicrobiota bacterium]MDK2962654.1 Ca-activated chloride channel [Verrucomicrobiota bacterium]